MFSSLCKRFQILWGDSLYRNSLWLMAGSFAMAGIGFIYWLVASKLYSPTEVGLAATFFSAVSLINGFATLGFNITLLRYLPASSSKDREVNTAFTVVASAALVLGIIYLLGLSIWTDKLLFLRNTLPIFVGVALFFPLNTINAITDSVFTAFREAQWVFLSNVTQSIAKLLALVLLPALGVWGIINSNTIGVLVAVVLCIFLIELKYKIRYRPMIDQSILTKVRRYAFGNYISGMIGTLPALLLPLIITNRVSAEQTAYFYMPNMLASLLGIIPSTISRSYFTESAHSGNTVSMKNPVLLTYSIVSPLVLLLIFCGKSILSLFGHSYSVNGYHYLLLVSIAVLLSIANYFLGSKLLVEHKMKKFTTITACGSATYLFGSLILTKYGIEGIGIAAILNQIVSFLLLMTLK